MEAAARRCGSASLAEGATLVGGALGLAMGPHLGTRWITYPLGDYGRLAFVPRVSRDT